MKHGNWGGRGWGTRQREKEVQVTKKRAGDNYEC